MTQPKKNPNAIRKAEKKAEKEATKLQRIIKLENALKEIQAQNSKVNTMLASIRAKLESLQMQIDHHQSGFEYLIGSSEKLRDSLHWKYLFFRADRVVFSREWPASSISSTIIKPNQRPPLLSPEHQTQTMPSPPPPLPPVCPIPCRSAGSDHHRRDQLKASNVSVPFFSSPNKPLSSSPHRLPKSSQPLLIDVRQARHHISAGLANLSPHCGKFLRDQPSDLALLTPDRDAVELDSLFELALLSSHRRDLLLHQLSH
ncbi:hypothetical protein PEBR_19381 [Penicillium brasilianum]|uniref:Uncharacterized protein n=1 Tax=Penicillium brasilianum TaxID=104259 RepID=A0A1S9RPK9_PENBI|nr:hypothetical protein PEBR_19381 [Penicillium brasilianum]